MCIFLFQALVPHAYMNYPARYGEPPAGSTSSLFSADWLTRLADFLLPPAGAQSGPLDSTPEFDLEDPYIVDKAAELGNDPQRIFRYVRDEIGYEVYTGSLRGARGTLWSGAGNALDQASLLIALLRASGVPARYAAGTLAEEAAQILIASMFEPAPYRVVGFVPDGAEVSDSVNDPALIAEARPHYWVEFNAGGGFKAADPSFKQAGIGESFAATEEVFEEVPDERRHRVTVRLIVEKQDGVLLGPLLNHATVLDETFSSAELVGKPLSIGHFVDTKPEIGLFAGNYTHTYSPYLLIGQNDGDITDDPIIRGDDYQEFLSSSFSGLANSILTGVFLEVDVVEPDGGVERFERALLDRVGFVARQGGGAVILDGIDAEQPAINEQSIATLDIESSLFNSGLIAQAQADELEALKDQLSALGQDFNPEGLSIQDSTIFEVNSISKQFTLVLTQTTSRLFSEMSQDLTKQFADSHLVKSYFSNPRIKLISTKTVIDPVTFQISIDILRNPIRVVAHPEQAKKAIESFYLVRGFSEAAIEDEIIQSLIKHSDEPENFALRPTAIAVFNKAYEQGINIIFIDSRNFAVLETLEISKEAKIRIAQVVEEGKMVIVPERNVNISGAHTVSWFEYDPASGDFLDTNESGGHAANMLAYVRHAGVMIYNSKLLSYLAGLTVGYFAGIHVILFAAGHDPSNSKVIKSAIGAVMATLLFFGNAAPGFTLGFTIAFGFVLLAAAIDPPLPGMLVGLSVSSIDPISPGTQPGVNTHVIPEPIFTLPVNQNQLTSLHRLHIQNIGPEEATYRITFPDQPAGFSVKSSLPEVTVPPGETGIVGIMLIPENGIPNPGTQVPFEVEITDSVNGITETVTETFVTPDVVGITLKTTPGAAATTPGESVNATLTVTSTGNVPAENIPLTLDVPQGLTVTGNLPATVTLDRDESRSFDLVLTPAAGTENETLTATVTAKFGEDLDGNPYEATAAVSVTVRTPAVAGIDNSAIQAAQLGNTNLANELTALANNIALLEQDGADTRICERISRHARNVQALLASNDSLYTSSDDLDVLISAADACDSATIKTAAIAIFDVLTPILRAQAEHGFSLSSTPARLALEPGESAELTLSLTNTGAKTIVIDLGIGALPENVSASLSSSQLTLTPGETNESVSVTIDQTITSFGTFNLAVTANAQSAAGLTKTDNIYISIRPALADVVRVTLEPNVVENNEPVAVSATINNTANIPQDVIGKAEIKDPEGELITTLGDFPLSLMPSTELVTLDMGTVDTGTLEQGFYNLHVSLYTGDGQPLPGRSAHSPLFIGAPVSVTVRAVPDEVVPGSPTVRTEIGLYDLEWESRLLNPKLDGNLLNIVETIGTDASSIFSGKYLATKAIDGNLDTSWFTSATDSPSNGASPWLEIVFPVVNGVTVSEVRIFGNRNFPNGHDVLSGYIALYSDTGELLYETEDEVFSVPDGDFTFSIPDVENVYRLVFHPTSGEGNRDIGIAEIEVYGVSAPSDNIIELVPSNVLADHHKHYYPGRLQDGALATSWFVRNPIGSSITISLLKPQSINTIRLFGNREFSEGYDVLSIDVSFIDDNGDVVHQADNLLLQGKWGDISHKLPETLEGVKKVIINLVDVENPDEAGLAEIVLLSNNPISIDRMKGTPFDLRDWETINFDIQDQGESNWDVSEDGRTVLQTINSDPSIFLSDIDVTGVKVTGNWIVETGNDDDFMGFVFGYQDSQHFYLFDWKQTNQNWKGTTTRGMTLKVVDSENPLPPDGGDLWVTDGKSGTVRTLFHNDIPWEDFVTYGFELNFTPGRIEIIVRDFDDVIEHIVIEDSTYLNGKFGFYNLDSTNKCIA